MAEPTQRPPQGLLDTSVVIDLDVVDPNLLPDESAIAAVTLAELAAGPHATGDEQESARRQDRLQWAAATWDPLPFDTNAARMYGRIFAAVPAVGRTSRPRLADPVSYTHLRAHETDSYLVCRLLLEKKKK